MYQHKCLSCGYRISDPGDEELVEGFTSPVRYRHKDYTGCQEAMRVTRYDPRRPRKDRTPPHRTLEQIEDRPDTPWNRRRGK
jgi:hypothetical protein